MKNIQNFLVQDGRQTVNTVL